MPTLYERAQRVIPMATQTSSKAACRLAYGFGPTHAICGVGAEVLGDNGQTYIDWAMGLGPVLLGHANPDVTQAAARAMIRGTAHSMPTEMEVQLAEKLHEWVPCAEMVRFLKTGSDATAAAVRLARGFTGREKIVRCGYHGWHDWALNHDYADKVGVPQCVRDLTVSVLFADLDALSGHLVRRDVAAFILEPVSLIPPPSWYLQSVRDLCSETGTVLIFDEVITGIRMAKGGAQAVFEVTPDLACFGKGLANGFPLSAVLGRGDIMRVFERTHISGTYNGETCAIAASLATLDCLERFDFWSHQCRVGLTLRHGYDEAVEKHGMQEFTRILGMPHYTSVQWNDPAHFTLFQQEMMRAGILFTGTQFPCLAHTTVHTSKTCQAYDSAMAVVAEAIRADNVASKLECAVNLPVFRRH